jgi:hypothetical protein
VPLQSLHRPLIHECSVVFDIGKELFEIEVSFIKDSKHPVMYKVAMQVPIVDEENEERWFVYAEIDLIFILEPVVEDISQVHFFHQ